MVILLVFHVLPLHLMFRMFKERLVFLCEETVFLVRWKVDVDVGCTFHIASLTSGFWEQTVL